MQEQKLQQEKMVKETANRLKDLRLSKARELMKETDIEMREEEEKHGRFEDCLRMTTEELEDTKMESQKSRQTEKETHRLDEENRKAAALVVRDLSIILAHALGAIKQHAYGRHARQDEGNGDTQQTTNGGALSRLECNETMRRH